MTSSVQPLPANRAQKLAGSRQVTDEVAALSANKNHDSEA